MDGAPPRARDTPKDDQEGLVFLPLSAYADQDAALATVLELVQEAGNPYFDWFFGSSERALATLAALVRQASSEIAARRVKLAIAGGEVVGMYVALSGGQLARCRQSDTIALLKHAGRGAARAAIVGKLAISRDLFPPVERSDFYLSKIGVVVGKRRRGVGRAIAEDFLAAGRRAGFRCFCLDVSADNQPAIRMYRALGFRIDSEQKAPGMRYLSMRLVETQQPRSGRRR